MWHEKVKDGSAQSGCFLAPRHFVNCARASESDPPLPGWRAGSQAILRQSPENLGFRSHPAAESSK